MPNCKSVLPVLVVPVLLCFLAPAARAQLVGTATWSGTTGGSANNEVGIDFRVGHVSTGLFDALFEEFTFDSSSVGQTVEATGLTDTHFVDVIGVLTNGLPELACLKITKQGSAVTLCDQEDTMFGLVSTDFQGEQIRRVTMEIVELEFAGNDLNYNVVVRLYADGPNTEPCVVALLDPAHGSLLDNGCSNVANPIVWDFAWDLCEGASDYNLVVQATPTSIPVVDVIVPEGLYHHEGSGFIANSNRINWKWQVRARVAGEWGEFTQRTFHVEPVGTDCTVATETITWGSVKGRF